MAPFSGIFSSFIGTQYCISMASSLDVICKIAHATAGFSNQAGHRHQSDFAHSTSERDQRGGRCHIRACSRSAASPSFCASINNSRCLIDIFDFITKSTRTNMLLFPTSRHKYECPHSRSFLFNFAKCESHSSIGDAAIKVCAIAPNLSQLIIIQSVCGSASHKVNAFCIGARGQKAALEGDERTTVETKHTVRGPRRQTVRDCNGLKQDGRGINLYNDDWKNSQMHAESKIANAKFHWVQYVVPCPRRPSLALTSCRRSARHGTFRNADRDSR